MSDPRARRAARLRELVLDTLKRDQALGRNVGLSSYVIWWNVRESFPGSLVTDAQLRHALDTLRKQGAVRYHDRRWELVPS